MREVALVFFGMLVGLIPGWAARKRRLKTHWRALRAELILCNEKATMVFSAEPLVMAPLYRLPLTTYRTSFAVLLSDGAVSEADVRVLGRFFGQVEDINRGLDNAAAMFSTGHTEKLQQEFDRNCLKARGLVEPQAGEPSLYVQALAVVDRGANPRWSRYSAEA
jgi:hypothetical protein